MSNEHAADVATGGSGSPSCRFKLDPATPWDNFNLSSVDGVACSAATSARLATSAGSTLMRSGTASAS